MRRPTAMLAACGRRDDRALECAPHARGITISGQFLKGGHATIGRLHIWRTFMRFRLALGVLGLLGASVAVQAQGLDDLKAREIIGPFYGLLTVATRGDVLATEERILTPDYQSCPGNLPSECRDRETMITVRYSKVSPNLPQTCGSTSRMFSRRETASWCAGNSRERRRAISSVCHIRVRASG